MRKARTFDEGGVTADDAMRLARYFSATPEFWQNLRAG